MVPDYSARLGYQHLQMQVEPTKRRTPFKVLWRDQSGAHCCDLGCRLGKIKL